MRALPRLLPASARAALHAALATVALVATLLAAAPPARAASSGLDGTTSGPHFVGSYSALRITYGQGWRVWGEVDTSGGVPVSDGVVNLGRKVYGHPWELLRTDSTAASFDFTTTPRKRTSYQLCYVGTGSPVSDPVCTRVMTVKVHRRLSLPKVHPRAQALTGRVRPGYKHRKVVVQKKHCKRCAWHRMTVVRTNERSVWRVHVPVRRMRYRAVVRGSDGYLRSHSRAQVVVVRRITTPGA